MNKTDTQAPPSQATSVATGTPSQAIDQATKDKIRNNAGGKCEYCGISTIKPEKSRIGVTPAETERQTDRYKPVAKGGTDDESNLAHSCRKCNRVKSDVDPTDSNDAAGQKWRLPRM